MKAYQVKKFLDSIETKIEIGENHLFCPRERHIELSLDKKRGIDPSPYMQMRNDGIEPEILDEELVPKLIFFLNKTHNFTQAREVRENLG